MRSPNLITTALVAAGLTVSQASAEITFTGTIDSVMPQVNFDAMGLPVAHVKNFYIEIQKDAIECDLKTVEWEAQNTHLEGAKPLCFFEWTGELNGLAVNDLFLQGVLNQSDELNFGYQVSILDQGQKDIILTDVYTVNVAAPEVPQILDAIVKWTDGDEPGLTQENFNANRHIRGFEVIVDERPYSQKVAYGPSECEVEQSQTSCQLSVDVFTPGDGEAESVGSFVDAFEVSDSLDYLQPEVSVVSIDYDYRSPDVVDFIVNGVGSMDPVTHTVGAQDVVVNENEAIIVLSTPHLGRDGDWYLPEVRDLSLSVTEANGSTRQLEVNSQLVSFPVSAAVPDTMYRIVQKGSPITIDEFTVIRYDIRSLPDGEYQADIIVTDSYQNSRDVVQADKLVDRGEPSIVALLDDVQLRPRSPIETYFLDDVFFAAHGGWDDGTSITRVSKDGDDVAFTRISDKIVRLENEDGLTANEVLTYQVEAQDGNGNISSEQYQLTYNPSSFRVVDAPTQVYEYVHELDLGFYQVNGTRCIAAATPELATLISTSMQKGCVVEFPNLPDGLEVSSRGSIFNIEGSLGALGNYEIDYLVTYYNQDGTSVEVSSGTTSIEAIETPPLEIVMSNLNRISENLYSVPYDSTTITRSFFDKTNGEVLMTLSAGDDEVQKTLRAAKRMRYSTESSFIERIGDINDDLWQRTPYTMSLEYPKIAGSRVEHTFDVVVTPSRKTRSYLDISLGEQGTSDEMASVKINVGNYDRRTGVFDYDVQSMGGWSAELAVETPDGYQSISDPMDVDANGQATFDIPAQTLFDSGDKYVAIVNSNSAVEGFEREIRSRSQRIRVLKGTAIEGEIEDYFITDEIPFKTALYYDYTTRDDEAVAGERHWQVSNDGVTWVDALESTGERKYIETTVPGETWYRYKTVNLYTGVVSYSNSAKIVGFELMEFEIEGPRKLIRDQVAEFSVVELSDLVGAPDAIYEYSVDDGSTWTEFVDSFEYGSSVNFILLVRNKLDSSSDDAGEESYEVVRHVVKVEEALRVRPNLRNVRFAEANYPISLEGTVRLGNSGVVADIISEIVLPNGDVVTGPDYEYVVQESDIIGGQTTFIFRAWVDGFREATIAQDTIVVPTKTYEFPSGEFFVSTYYGLAPSEIDATIRGIETDVNGVEFTFDWSIDEVAFEITRQSEQRVSVRAVEAGLHMLSVDVSDNRGNEQTYSQLITIEDADPMTIEYVAEVNKDSYRAPLTVSVRANVELGHRADGIDTYQWYLNDELQDSSAKYGNIRIDSPGEHEIRVVVTSDFGQTGSYTHGYTVLPNIPPSCSPSIRMRGEDRYVAHNCEDPDGEIMYVRYDWVVASKLNVIREEYFSNLSHPNATVTITAVDDGGEEVVYEVSW